MILLIIIYSIWSFDYNHIVVINNTSSKIETTQNWKLNKPIPNLVFVIHYWPDGEVYDGEWVDGTMDGFWILGRDKWRLLSWINQ